MGMPITFWFLGPTCVFSYTFSTASVDQQSWQDNPQKLSPEFEWKILAKFRFSQIFSRLNRDLSSPGQGHKDD